MLMDIEGKADLLIRRLTSGQTTAEFRAWARACLSAAYENGQAEERIYDEVDSWTQAAKQAEDSILSTGPLELSCKTDQPVLITRIAFPETNYRRPEGG